MLLVQVPSLANVLPHARAETSNTGSNRKEGAVYGFLAGEADESSVLSFVDLLSISKLVIPLNCYSPNVDCEAWIAQPPEVSAAYPPVTAVVHDWLASGVK